MWKKLKRQEIPHHTAQLCSKRTVLCSLCQREDLWAEELVSHQANECSHRIIPCSLNCEIPGIKAGEMTQHQRDTCPRRMIQCECGLSFESKDLDQHKRLDCVYRSVGCPQGCGEAMAFYLIDNHIEYFCKNRNHIYDRVEECPNGCGLSMMRKELLHHVTYECVKRLIECSLNCGNTMSYDNLPAHLVVCPNRIVCCEPNLTMCAKPLHQWLYKDVIPIDMSTVPSSHSLMDYDDSTAPTTAASTIDRRNPGHPQPETGTVISSLAMGTFRQDDLSYQLSPGKNPFGNTTTLFDGQSIQLQITSNPATANTNNKNNNTTSFFQNLKIVKKNNPTLSSSALGGGGGGEGHRTATTDSHTFSSPLNTAVEEEDTSSSIYYDQHAMKFRDSLRMCFCDKHHSSIVMASIRYDQIDFLEYIIKQIKQTQDIDAENIYGDTALTLACRLGKLEFVELLVQNGADINKETSNGRTALIEAVKSNKEHIALIEYLIKEGCIVAYKTRRHHRSSLDWARRYAISEAAALVERHFQATGEKLVLTHEKKRLLGRPRTVRILELAAVVQKQSNLLFQQIALGNNAVVLKAIENGDFFDANMEANCYKQMEIFVERAEACDLELNEIQLKLGKNSSRIDSLAEKRKELSQQFQELDKTLKKCYRAEKDWDAMINQSFIAYENSMAHIFSEDLEEIGRYQYPSKILLTSLFISGILYDLFPAQSYRENEKYPLLYQYITQGEMKALTTERIVKEKSSWWLQLLLKIFLAKSKELIRSMQSYTRAKLHIDRSKQLFQQARQWLQLLIDCSQEEHGGGGGSQLLLLENTSSRPATSSYPLLQIMTNTNTSTRPNTTNSEGYYDESLRGIVDDPSSLEIPYDDFVSPQRKGRRRNNPLGDTNNTTNTNSYNNSYNNSRPQSPESRQYSPPRSPGSPSHSGSASPSSPHRLIRSGTSSPTRRRLTAEEKYIKELEKEYGLDSDEENKLQGEWVKGEWVPHKKKSKSSKLKLQLFKTLSEGQKPFDGWVEEKNTDAEALEELDQRLVVITDRLIQESKQRTLSELKQTMQQSFHRTMNAKGGGGSEEALVLYDAAAILRDGLMTPEERALTAATAASSTAGGMWDDQDDQAEEEENFSTTGGSPHQNRHLKRNKSTRSFSLSRTSSASSLLSNDSLKSGRSGTASPSRAASPMSSPKLSRRSTRRKFSASTNNTINSEDSPYHQQSSRKKHKDRRHRRKSTAFQSDDDRLLAAHPLGPYSSDSLVGYSFIQSIIYLLKAIIRYQLYYSQILAQKPTIFKAVNQIEQIKADNKEIIEEYEKLVTFRSKQEKEYVTLLKRARFLQEKLTAFRDRVRIARLMNYVSVNGHTLISWTAAYGNYEVMEAMLSRGATVGFNASLLHLTATYLQLSYQIYRVTCQKYPDYQAKTSTTSSAVISIDGAAGLLKKAANIRIIQELTVLKEKRAKLLAKIHYQKYKIRFPIPEAIYAGKWEIVHRIYERRLWHCHTMHTWTFPSPPPPFSRDLSHQYEHQKLTPMELLSHAMNNLASGAYIAEKGWVPPNHPEEPYGELSIHLEKILLEIVEKQKAFRLNRYRIRALSNERKNQKSGEQEMVQAIYRRDYRHCIYLAENRGITIDLETPDGSTALISAAEEDADALNHEYMTNDDGSKCLFVEYLLDRHYYRPAINLETTAGYTALLRACVLGRSHVVVALLDRGANINHVNRFGKAPIHYAASLGHSEITRILVERFADLTLRDNQGRTAYEIAEQENFVHLMKLLSQFRSGNLGPLQLTRGRVNNQVTCPNGCGAILFLQEKKDHLLVCPYRIVSCPNHCSRLDLQYKELAEHVSTTCEYRVVACQLCKSEFSLRDQQTHDEEHCIYRVVPCPNRCERTDLQFVDLSMHLANRCSHRKLPCPLHCGLSIREIDMNDHLAESCEMRRITCPNKCHHQVIAGQLALHLAEHCPARAITCPQCDDNTVICQELDYHLRELCRMRGVPCPEKCHAMIPFCQVTSHLETVCDYRLLTCPNIHCGMKIQRKFLTRHLEKECLKVDSISITVSYT